MVIQCPSDETGRNTAAHGVHRVTSSHQQAHTHPPEQHKEDDVKIPAHHSAHTRYEPRTPRCISPSLAPYLQINRESIAIPHLILPFSWVLTSHCFSS